MTRFALQRSLQLDSDIDQAMLRFVLDQSRDCVKILGPGGEVDYVNSQARCELEIDEFEEIAGRPWAELWPEGSREVIETAVDLAQKGESSEIEASRPSSSGDELWWRTSVSPLLDRAGQLVGILIVSRNITAHVRVRESERTLALEMRHRLRNAYAVSSAIVMQSARSFPDALPFAELVCNRLADVALSQTRLLDASNKSWSLAELIRTLIEAHGDGASRVRYAGDARAAIDGQTAMLVALVVGELTNNSLKYGALCNGRNVSISATIDDGLIALRWKERTGKKGPGKLKPRDPASGYSMMERMARAQRASFAHELVNGELIVTLHIPLSDQ